VSTRSISIPTHALIEIVAAPVLMAAPFVLGFAQATGVVTFGLGALLLSLAISTVTDQRTIPLSAHADFDYALAVATIVAGLVFGVATSDPVATAFLVGFGAAHLALTASTRYSARGA
jgi:hypothetical protein